MILRDPVHGLVSFESSEQRIIEELLECREVQRLRRIRQLGLTSLAYPGADHTRFSHALGVAHVMTRFLHRMKSLRLALPSEFRLSEEHEREALAAALLHDIGHGPFSHLFEDLVPGARAHESWSTELLLDPSTDVGRTLARYGKTFPERVADLVRGKHPLPYLARAVSGTFDVDRCDYLLRDAHFTGVNYGRFDLDWLLRSFCLTTPDGAPGLAIDGTKGLPAIESFILARLFMFQQVYFHKASRASEWLLGRLFRRVRECLTDGSPLRLPRALEKLAVTGSATLGEYLSLDDSIVWSVLAELESSEDPLLSDLSRRLLARRLFKSFELFGTEASPEGRAQSLAVVRGLAEKRGLPSDFYVGLDVPSVAAFDDAADPITVLFPDGSERKPGDVSFLLGRLRGQTLSRPRLIFAAELRNDVTKVLGERAPKDASFAGGSFLAPEEDTDDDEERS